MIPTLILGHLVRSLVASRAPFQLGFGVEEESDMEVLNPRLLPGMSQQKVQWDER